jgi:energy-coupling factor transporter ATP-binding protein EcfA2
MTLVEAVIGLCTLDFENRHIVISIDGSSASGKTTLAKNLASLLNGETVHCDDFFLPAELRTEKRLNEAGGNIHYERLKAEDAKIHFYSGIIFEIAELYINETLYGNTTMIEHIGAMYVDEVYEQILPVLSYMITLHETLAPVSVDWTVEELLSQHSKAIEDAKDIIYNGNFTSYNFVFLHDLVSAWRTKNDYFEIIYSYYYFGGEELRAQITNMFQRVPLPADLQDIYMSIANGHTYANSLSQEGSEWIDTTTIFKSYFDIQKAKKELDESGSELSKGLYEFLNMDFFILNNLVYSANKSNVVLTMVDGEVLYKNGEFTTIDVEKMGYEVSKLVREVANEVNAQ